MNAGQTGFYRVNYERDNWDKLINQLNTSHQVIKIHKRFLQISKEYTLDGIHSISKRNYH